MPTDYNSLVKIVSTWVLCPLLSAAFAILFYLFSRKFVDHLRISIIRMDAYTRFGLMVVGAFGAYSLGANNIANVMGVFVPISPFDTAEFFSISLTSAQQLFFLGGLAISVGIITYSKRVMQTVGNDLFKLSPIAALVVVLASSTVLFLFASESLQIWLTTRGLPSLPLVPVSSSQAVVGAVLGIGLAKGGRNIKYGVLGKISVGWVTTPLASGAAGYVLLWIVHNILDMPVYL
jgi:PiT family inorganic phosphate transporter